MRLSAAISETWFLTDRDGEKGINGRVYPECIFVLMVTMNQVPQERFFTDAFRFLLLAMARFIRKKTNPPSPFFLLFKRACR